MNDAWQQVRCLLLLSASQPGTGHIGYRPVGWLALAGGQCNE